MTNTSAPQAKQRRRRRRPSGDKPRIAAQPEPARTSRRSPSSEPLQGAFTELLPELQKALTREGYHTPTPIQAAAIPHLVKQCDLMGCAQTGTGKTAAFTLPILQFLSGDARPPAPRCPRALILAPTRELAAQIGDSIAAYGQHLKLNHCVIFGGVNERPQINALKRGVDIVVATPGRLLDLLQQKYLDFKQVEVFVLDEADRMLDMGFIPDIKRVIKQLPAERWNLFFSATMPKVVETLAKSMLKNPVHIEIEPEQPTVEKIDQKMMFVEKGDKDSLLASLFADSDLNRVIVFTQMKHMANRVCEKLDKRGIPAEALHGNKSQGARTKALDRFKSGQVRVLVATDIAARGIDVDGISHVINYDLPNEPETYVHRIGRTARAGADGDAVSFCSARERDFLRDIERLLGQAVPVDTEHAYHSETARMAIGSDAKPEPRAQRGGGGGRQSRGGGQRAKPRGARAGGASRSGSFKPSGRRSQGRRSSSR